MCGVHGYKTTMTNKELASNHQEHQMEGSMHVRRIEDGYMHRRMQKNKHMQGNDLDTPTDEYETGTVDCWRRMLVSICCVPIKPRQPQCTGGVHRCKKQNPCTPSSDKGTVCARLRWRGPVWTFHA